MRRWEEVREVSFWAPSLRFLCNERGRVIDLFQCTAFSIHRFQWIHHSSFSEFVRFRSPTSGVVVMVQQHCDGTENVTFGVISSSCVCARANVCATPTTPGSLREASRKLLGSVRKASGMRQKSFGKASGVFCETLNRPGVLLTKTTVLISEK